MSQNDRQAWAAMLDADPKLRAAWNRFTEQLARDAAVIAQGARPTGQAIVAMPGKSYMIELTAEEAVLVDRMAADRAKTPEEIVQHLVRSRLFNAAAAINMGQFTWHDIVNDVVGPNQELSDHMVREISRTLIDGVPETGEKMQ